MLATVSEYTYEPTRSHLNEAEALDEYKQALKNHTDALVVLDDLDCGHWNVTVLETDEEKEDYYRRKAMNYYNTFLSTFMKYGGFHSRRVRR